MCLGSQHLSPRHSQRYSQSLDRVHVSVRWKGGFGAATQRNFDVVVTAAKSLLQAPDLHYRKFGSGLGESSEGQKRYSPAECIGCERKTIVGNPHFGRSLRLPHRDQAGDAVPERLDLRHGEGPLALRR